MVHERTVQALIEHGVRWRMNGFPVYSEPDMETGDSEMIGRMFEPEWDYNDLSPSQLSYLWEIITEGEADVGMQHRFPDLDERRRVAFVGNLGHYGIRCPHVPAHRVYSPRDGGRTSECCDCHAMLVTERSAQDYHDDDRRRTGEFVPQRDLRCQMDGLPMRLVSISGERQAESPFADVSPSPLSANTTRETLYRCDRGHYVREGIPWSQAVGSDVLRERV